MIAVLADVAVGVGGVAIGTLLGPQIRMYVAQVVTDVKTEYAKEKAVLQAELTKLDADFTAYKANAATVIGKLQSDLNTAETKLETITSLFQQKPQPSVVPSSVTVTTAAPVVTTGNVSSPTATT